MLLLVSMARRAQSSHSNSNEVTGYSLYNQEARKRRKENPLDTLYPSLPEKKFSVIYADPPWDYGGKLQFDKSSTSKEDLNLSKPIFISSATFKYPTLTLAQLKELPVQSISEDDCLLFMWTSSPHLAHALELGQAWGFTYRTVAFVWDKMCHNPGKYTLSNCELCLVFKRGRIPTPRGARNVQQLIRFPRGKHSEKPRAVAEAILKMFPSQAKVELFAREALEGWDVWGLEARSGPSIEQGHNSLFEV